MASIAKESLSTIPTSFATVSVGTSDTPLPDKLSAISKAGFQAIELGFPDLLSFASTFHKKEIQENDYDSLCSAGQEVKKLCEQNKLQIMMLQPFSNFEGWPEGSDERKDAFERARGWIKIMGAVGTDMLQVGSTDSVGISTDFKVLASDLRELADLLAEHNYRLAYENWCWATVAPTWKEVWEIVQLVDRPNIGLCLDTFQTAGGEYGDPTTPSGLISHQGTQHKLHMNLEHSLHHLTQSIPAEKIYLLQISDAYKPLTPIPETQNPKEDMRARGKWSHDYRPYPFNGGYLPVVEVARAVLGTGFRGWFSMEVFDGGEDGKWETQSVKDIEGFCKGAMESHKKLLEECASGNGTAKKG
ncbi:3-dehydroshikimate dehydratase protein [Rutstroemia sp. NJR-2017a WRK4]|nr:3-dehydroshikimate dehydratase protein [Rutstroemia sp. NJR-2017a WRK4]